MKKENTITINGKTIDADESLYKIEDLVIGNILECEKNHNGTTYISSPIKYIFQKSICEGRNIYHDVFSNDEIKSFDDPFIDLEHTNRYITNIENLTDYIDIKYYNQNTLLDSEDILDLQEAVNMIIKEEHKNKIKQKSL